MTDRWKELKETIIELRDNDGTGTQQEVCKFLANLMNVLEKQIQEPKTGYWILTMPKGSEEWCYKCSRCGFWKYKKTIDLSKFYCPNCGAKMVEPQESEDKE